MKKLTFPQIGFTLMGWSHAGPNPFWSYRLWNRSSFFSKFCKENVCLISLQKKKMGNYFLVFISVRPEILLNFHPKKWNSSKVRQRTVHQNISLRFLKQKKNFALSEEEFFCSFKLDLFAFFVFPFWVFFSSWKVFCMKINALQVPSVQRNWSRMLLIQTL